jgi:Tol biopolymer transport system component
MSVRWGGVVCLGFASFCGAAERILFLRIAPTESHLFISNRDGAGEQVLAKSTGLDYNPAWSPKGNWIAFTSERDGSADLYQVHPDGTGLTRLTDDPAYDDQASFSPDGGKIVFVSTRGGGIAKLWLLDPETRQVKRLTSGAGGDFRPAWSPDGKWIAFSSDRGSNLPAAKGRWERLHLVDIYIVRPDGTELKRVSKHGGFCGNPKWTADSSSVIGYCMPDEDTWTFRVAPREGETELVRFDIANGNSSPVASGAGVKMFPAVLASGETAWVRRDSPAQGVFYSNGKTGPSGSDLRGPSWSPDGNRVVYSRFKSDRKPEPAKVWSRNAKYELASTAFLPAYSSAGDRFAVTASAGGGKHSSLYVIEDGKPARTILEREELMLAPQWSPDGSQIALGSGVFSSFLDFDVGRKIAVDRANGGAQVAIVKADGSGFHTITSGPNNNAFPSYSPDGKRLVYRTAGPDGDGLRIMNLEDQSVRVLTKEYDNFAVWSPRADLIAFVRQTGGNFEVFTIKPDGSELKQLTNTPGNEAHLCWSPDGERIAFTSTRMGFKDEALYTFAPQPYGEIFVMRYDGTELEQLTDDQWEEGGPAWQPRKK